MSDDAVLVRARRNWNQNLLEVLDRQGPVAAG
jgi:hypothetical protein